MVAERLTKVGDAGYYFVLHVVDSLHKLICVCMCVYEFNVTLIKAMINQ